MAGLFDDLVPSTPQITVRPQSAEANAISSVESGGRYDATGPVTRTGDRAFGKYQVMGANVGPWTKQYVGQEMTPQQFAQNPEAQEAVFKGEFGRLSQKYGPEGAARAWFAGEGGMNDMGRKDILGTSVADYSRKFTSAMPKQAVQQQPQQESAPAAAPMVNLFSDLLPAEKPQVEQRFGDMQAPVNAKPLQAGLERRAVQMTTGPATTPAQSMAIDFSNLIPAASQGTNPRVGAYKGKLISDDVHEDDGGNILYRDQQTGKLVQTDNSKQVAIRDPADNRVKVFERSADTDEGPLTGAARVLAPGLAAGGVTARPSIPSSANVKPNASDIFSTAKAPYRKFTEEASKIEIPADTATGIGDRLRGALDRMNLSSEMAGSPANSAIKMLESGNPMTLDFLQRVKRMAARGFDNPVKDVRDGAKAITKEIEKVISEVSPEAFKNLKTGDQIHSTALALQDLQRKGAVSDLRAGRAGYGGNAVNSMRQVLSPIVQRATEGKSTSFRPDEIQAIREIVEGTPATNGLRLVGQLSPTSGLGVIKSAGAGGTAMAAGASGGMAILIPAIGAASNKLATVMTGQQIDRLKELVAKRSPAYAEAVSKAVQRYETAQMELVNNPTPAKFASYVTAARALSAGLQKDGVSISSGHLLRQIEGPVKAAAEGEEPSVQRGPGE